MDLICPECGQPCKATTIDVGVGSYEFWGACGNDMRLVTVSDCCEADLPDDVVEGLGDCDE